MIYTTRKNPSHPSKYSRSEKRAKNENLQLELQQVADHLTTGHPRSRPQSREVEGAGEGIGITEEEHGSDPATRVFERKARLGHAVLLDVAAVQVVHRALGVHLGLEVARCVGKLGALENVEVVVGSVTSRVAFSANSGT